MSDGRKKKFRLGPIVREFENEKKAGTPTQRRREKPGETDNSLPKRQNASQLSRQSAADGLPPQPRFHTNDIPNASFSDTRDTCDHTRENGEYREQIRAQERNADASENTSLRSATRDDERVKRPPVDLHPSEDHASNDADHEEEEFDILHYVGVLLRRKTILLLSTFLFFCFALYSYMTAQRYYSARARMLFSPGHSDIISDPLSAWEAFGSREKRINTHLELLQSDREVMRRVSEELGNAVKPGAVKQGLSIHRSNTDGEKNNIIELRYKHSSAEIARDVLNTLCRVYIDYINEVNVQDLTATIIKFKTQIQKIQGELNEKEDALRLFKEKNRMVQLSTETNLVVTKLSNVEVALQETYLELLESKERLEALQREIKRQEPNVVQSMTYENPYENRLADLEFELHVLSAEYSPDHYKIKTIKEQIESLKNALRTNIEKQARTRTFVKNPIRESLLQTLVNLTISKASLEAKRTALEQIAAKLNDNLLELPALEKDYAFLQRETQSLVQTLNNLKNQYEKIKIKRDSQESDLKILEMADTPRRAVSSVKSSRVIIGLFLGLVIGIALAFLLEYLDQSVKHPREMEKVLGIPLLGILPLVEDERAIIELSDKKTKTELEPLRALRANLKHIFDANAIQTVLISSAVKGEGKTTLACNLAIIFAMDGRKVILIDGDLRRSKIHSLLSIEKQLGVADYLLSSADIEDILKPTVFENLSVITSGERPSNPSELLGTVKFNTLLQEVRRYADLIIVDSPAILPVSDAITIAPKMDASLFLTRSMWTPLNAAKQAKGQLARMGCTIIGGILNGVAHSRDYYPYYYGYYHYYAYRYTYDENQTPTNPLREFGIAFESKVKNLLRAVRMGYPRWIRHTRFFTRYVLTRKMFWILVIVLGLSIGVSSWLQNNAMLVKDTTVTMHPSLVKLDHKEANIHNATEELQPPASPKLADKGIQKTDTVFSSPGDTMTPVFSPDDSLRHLISALNAGAWDTFLTWYDKETFHYNGGDYTHWVHYCTDTLAATLFGRGKTSLDETRLSGNGDPFYETVSRITAVYEDSLARAMVQSRWKVRNSKWRIVFQSITEQPR